MFIVEIILNANTFVILYALLSLVAILHKRIDTNMSILVGIRNGVADMYACACGDERICSLMNMHCSIKRIAE